MSLCQGSIAAFCFIKLPFIQFNYTESIQGSLHRAPKYINKGEKDNVDKKEEKNYGHLTTPVKLIQNVPKTQMNIIYLYRSRKYS